MAKKNTKKQKEKMKLKKGASQFNLVGEAKVSDFTYDLDKVSDSKWQYNRFNLGVDCGNGNVVYAGMMGGFRQGSDQNVVYAQSKEDYTERMIIDFKDRNDEKIMESVADFSKIKIGLEKNEAGKTFVKEFLSEYDAIKYISEVLEDGMVVNVKGNLKFQLYQDEVQMQKEITSIFLSKAEPKDYKATFQQTILVNSDSVDKFDKEEKVFPVMARVVDYCKMWGDKEVKTMVPYLVNFEIPVTEKTVSPIKKLIERYLKPKEGVNEIVVEGNIVEGQENVVITEEDIPDDIMELIDMGVLNKEDIIEQMAAGGERVKKLQIIKPSIKKSKKDENNPDQVRVPELMVVEGKYQEEDLMLDFMYEDVEDDEVPFDTDDNEEKDEDSDDEDMGWLDELE